MIGGANPADRQISSILPRSVALAAVPGEQVVHPVDCRGGDVKGVNPGLLGQTTFGEEIGRQRSDIARQVQDGNPSDRLKPSGCCLGISPTRLVDHELRDVEIMRRPATPPLFRDLLVSRSHKVTTWTRRQVADDGCFYLGFGIHPRSTISAAERPGVDRRSPWRSSMPLLAVASTQCIPSSELTDAASSVSIASVGQLVRGAMTS